MLEERLEQALRLAIDPPGGLNTAALRDLIRDDENTQWDIATTAEYLGISAHTLRYYERIGLIPPVPRTQSGLRDYDEESCSWVEFIKCMRNAGVAIEALIEYVALFRQGESTREQRKQLLMEQRQRLCSRIHEMEQTLQRLDAKIENYEKWVIPVERRLFPSQELEKDMK